MNPLGSIQYEGNRYVLAAGKWNGPDRDAVAILNGLFRLSTCSHASTEVLPLGYECIRTAAKWAGDSNPELPRFRAGPARPGAKDGQTFTDDSDETSSPEFLRYAAMVAAKAGGDLDGYARLKALPEDELGEILEQEEPTYSDEQTSGSLPGDAHERAGMSVEAFAAYLNADPETFAAGDPAKPKPPREQPKTTLRPGLVWKQVDLKTGGKRWMQVKAAKPTQPEQPPSPPKPPSKAQQAKAATAAKKQGAVDAETALKAALASPSAPIPPENVEALHNHLDKLAGEPLKALARQVGAKVSGKKAELVQRLKDHVARQAKEGKPIPKPVEKAPEQVQPPAPPSPPPPPPPDLNEPQPGEKAAPAPKKPAEATPAPENPAALSPKSTATTKSTHGVDTGSGIIPATTPKNVKIQAKDKELKKWFGQYASDHSLIGAAVNGADGAKIEVNDEAEDGFVQIDSEGEGYKAQRVFRRDEEGNLEVHNEEFEIYKNDDGTPLDPDIPSGTQFLTNQVAALQKLGVKKILTEAGGRGKNVRGGSTLNGYYSWPLMGYDGTVPAGTWETMPDDIKKLAGPNRDNSSVRAIVQNPEGRKWWKDNGSAFSAKFDLTPGSESLKQLSAYTAERKARKENESGTAN